MPDENPERVLVAVAPGALARDAFTFNDYLTPDRLFELRRGRRWIAGDVRNPDYDVATLVKWLDAFRLRAVRLQPR